MGKSLADLDTGKRKFNLWSSIRKSSLEVLTIVASWAFVELLIWSFNTYSLLINIIAYVVILFAVWVIMKITPKILKLYKKTTTEINKKYGKANRNSSGRIH